MRVWHIITGEGDEGVAYKHMPLKSVLTWT